MSVQIKTENRDVKLFILSNCFKVFYRTNHTIIQQQLKQRIK